ncbi:MAG: bifunctional [glutamate--ammonia ligase]-adenylyl-L-tyrosine phosphorylase/[glutamate--ammonia-ligase] adenylyltransferase [Pseudomonadota bacterium]
MTIEALPRSLETSLNNRKESLTESLSKKGLRLPDDKRFVQDLDTALLFSEFIAASVARDPEMLIELTDTGDLYRSYPENEFHKRLETQLAGKTLEQEMAEILSRFRMREMVRIAWQDLTGHACLDQTLQDLSGLADACVDKTFRFIYDKLCSALGTPVDSHGRPQHLIVLGMGKLGARELNFSSDIDLIFAYSEDGQTAGADRSISNEEFFTAMCRGFLKVFDSSQNNHRLFRVDTRLRPFGASGPLVMSMAGIEAYYQTQGREWERYALIKARPVAGDLDAGRSLLLLLNPFVFRRYFDYGTFDSLRDMKRRITLQVKDKRLKRNIKLGAGGIREVEFFGQIFQLIRGGVEPEYQEPAILKVLEILAERFCIDSSVKQSLLDAYVFLRRVENRLQAYADLQTHDLPEDEDARLRLALSMGYASWEDFSAELERHMGQVHHHFNQLLVTRDEAPDKSLDQLKYLWEAINDPQSEEVMVTLAGAENSERIIALLKYLEGHSNTKKLTSNGRRRLDRLVPLMVKSAMTHPDSVTVLTRLTDLIIAIERRTCYVSLLLENTGAMENLVTLAGKSPWIIAFLANHPALLDELLDPRTLYLPPGKDQMAKELQRRISKNPTTDFEFQLEELCLFRQVNTLRIAAADVSGDYPLMKVSDHLTWLAEVILDAVIAISWKNTAAKYGHPPGVDPGVSGSPGFAAVAYGKFGGIELGYKSDLDLVFIHSGGSGMTWGGPRSIETSRFYTLLGQRIINTLTMHTSAGTLYETDMRLRPSGQSGMIVSHIDAFREYIIHQAWTWEHQAIVRARPVCGDPVLQDAFNTIRHGVLSTERDSDTLRREVRDMRERMRAVHPAAETGFFDLKQGRGGIVDIEFLVQYLVLKHSHACPSLTRWTDNVRLLETLADQKILADSEAMTLKGAYLQLRKSLHRSNLLGKEQKAPLEEFLEVKNTVESLTGRYLYHE